MPVVPRDVIVSASELPTDDRAATGGRKAGFDFGRQRRLLAAAQYAAVFATRKTVRTARFVLHYLSSGRDASTVARLGLVIPKKQARSAVLRNAIKRQARDVFRHRCDGLTGLDIVLRLAQPVRSQGKTERIAWREEIAGLFDQASRKTRP